MRKWVLDYNFTGLATQELLKLFQSHNCFASLPLNQRTVLRTDVQLIRNVNRNDDSVIKWKILSVSIGFQFLSLQLALGTSWIFVSVWDLFFGFHRRSGTFTIMRLDLIGGSDPIFEIGGLCVDFLYQINFIYFDVTDLKIHFYLYQY